MPESHSLASHAFVILLLGGLFGIILYFIFNGLFPKKKKEEYRANNSYNTSPENNKHYKEEYKGENIVKQTGHVKPNFQDRISIKGQKFDGDESAAIIDAIKKGNNVEAIWLLRSKPGISLKDAKDFVATIETRLHLKSNRKDEPSNSSQTSARDKVDASKNASKEAALNVDLKNPQFNTIVSALESDNIIVAIKTLREATGLGLNEAKNIIENLNNKRRSVGITKEMILEEVKKLSKVQIIETNKLKEKKKSNTYTLSKVDYDAIVVALKNGNKIEAVQLLSSVTGLGLNEANQNIHKLEAKIKLEEDKNNLSESNPVESKFRSLEKCKIESEEILNAIVGGSKIVAITILKDATGFSLKEARDFVESLEKKIKEAPDKEDAITKISSLLAIELVHGENADLKRINI